MPPLKLIIFPAYLAASLALIFLAIRIIKKVEEGGKKSMLYFQLHPEQTLMDFKILLAAAVVLLFTLSLYLYGALIEENLLMNIHRFVGVFLFLLPFYVFYRWNRRLK